MKHNYFLITILIAGLLIAPASAVTYTDAIGFKWDTSSTSPTLTRVFANGTTASVVIRRCAGTHIRG